MVLPGYLEYSIVRFIYFRRYCFTFDLFDRGLSILRKIEYR